MVIGGIVFGCLCFCFVCLLPCSFISQVVTEQLGPVHTGDSRKSTQSTKPKVNKVVDCRLCHQFVAILSKVDCRRLIRIRQFVANDIVAKGEHVQLVQLCWKWVIFIAQMSNIFLTLSQVCTGPKRLARLSTKSTVLNATLSTVCAGPYSCCNDTVRLGERWLWDCAIKCARCCTVGRRARFAVYH